MTSLRSILLTCFSLVVVLTTIIPATAQNPSNQPHSPATPAEFVPGEILVKFEANISILQAQKQLHTKGLRSLEVSPKERWLRVNVTPGQETNAIEEILAQADVELATLNYYLQAVESPNDPYFSYQWSLNNTGQTGGLPDADIDAPEAWSSISGDDSIVVAIIDTGIDLDHPDLQANLTSGWDFCSNSKCSATDSNPDDEHGHGTHVAGIVAAEGNNGIGISGVSWNSKLMPVKALNSSGTGTTFSISNAIYYAVDNGSHIINMSLGAAGTTYPCTGFEAIGDAMQYALDNGRLVIVAAGNEDALVSCPAAFEQAFAVGATDHTDNRASYSNYGDPLDIVAPGSNIYSTIPGGYYYLSGTSMATPHVAGLASLIWAFNPLLDHVQVRQIIQNTADDLGTAGWDQSYAWGRINARQALASMSLETSPAQLTLLLNDADSSSVSGNITISTTNPEVINWTATISPTVEWLNLSEPTSGQVSSLSSDQEVTVNAVYPAMYGSYSTSVIISGTTTSGASVGPVTTEVQLNYVSQLERSYLPVIFK